MFVAVIISLTIATFISIAWVRGIDYMQKNHPDYKGEDFLHTSAGRDAWDDNLIHSEGDF